VTADGQPATSVVTGATSGIGRAITNALAAGGTRVWAVGRRTDALATLAREHSSIRTQPADLLVDADIERLAAAVLSEPDGLGVLVHAAGAAALGCVESAPVEELDLQYRVNVRAPFVLTQRLLPALRRAKGQVVFVNSSAGLHATAGTAQYAATKHALKALADSLRCEVNADGIRVLTVYPGRTASPMQEELHRQRELRAAEPRPYRPGDLLQPADVAAVVLQALSMPRTAEVTDVRVRPALKPD
jgi:NADP-dependent 3-hydroxy acid dehydrogenase YdfG